MAEPPTPKPQAGYSGTSGGIPPGVEAQQNVIIQRRKDHLFAPPGDGKRRDGEAEKGAAEPGRIRKHKR